MRTLTYLYVKACVFVPLVMSSVQFRNELISFDPGVLGQSAGQRLEGIGKLFDRILLQTRAGLQEERSRCLNNSKKRYCVSVKHL